MVFRDFEQRVDIAEKNKSYQKNGQEKKYKKKIWIEKYYYSFQSEQRKFFGMHMSISRDLVEKIDGE